MNRNKMQSFRDKANNNLAHNYIKRYGPVVPYTWFEGERELFDIAVQAGKISDRYLNHEHDPIIYTINEMGYRSKFVYPADYEKYGVAIGSSHTWGSSLHVEDRFDSLLEQDNGIPIINIGQPGASCNYVKEQVLHLLTNTPKLPAFMILEWPPITRFTLFGNGTEHICNVHFDEADIRFKIFENIVLLDEEIFYYEAMRSFHIVTKWLSDRDIPVFNWTVTPDSSETLQIPYTRTVDFARDGVHPGPNTHKIVADLLIENIQIHV